MNLLIRPPRRYCENFLRGGEALNLHQTLLNVRWEVSLGPFSQGHLMSGWLAEGGSLKGWGPTACAKVSSQRTWRGELCIALVRCSLCCLTLPQMREAPHQTVDFRASKTSAIRALFPPSVTSRVLWLPPKAFFGLFPFTHTIQRRQVYIALAQCLACVRRRSRSILRAETNAFLTFTQDIHAAAQ